MIKIGCCGWSYLSCKKYFGDEWKKGYESVLQCYAKLLSIVEINSTFYRIPKIETAEKWRQQVDKVNKNFEFTVKFNQIATHKDQFKTKASINTFNIFKEINKKLRAEILLIQCPASWNSSNNNIKNFKSFLNKIKNDKTLIAWEPRGDWWQNLDLIKEICKDFNLIHCVDPFRVSPQYFSNKKITYFRLHGFGKPSMYNYKFSKNELYDLKKQIEKLNAKEDYILFNNMAMYEDALEFKHILK